MRTWPALDVGLLTDPDLFEAALIDHRVTAVDSTTQPDACRLFFATEADRRHAAASLADQFPGATIRPLDVADEDWVSRSQESLRAIRVGEIVVAPPWDAPPETAPPLVIVIRPSMGFGTGHHATTRLCLRALQQMDLSGRRVLDVGTGSGLLAIAARRLGAGAVVAIDDDGDALEAAADNLALNPGVSGVTLRNADIQSLTAGAFDLIAANLTGALLVAAAPRLAALAAPGADLILSGFMHGEEAAVREAYRDLEDAARTEEDEWVCVTLHRR